MQPPSSRAHFSCAVVSFVVPSDIYLPRFTLFQHVAWSEGSGVIVGLEWVPEAIARRWENKPGWIYHVLADDREDAAEVIYEDELELRELDQHA